MAETTEKIYCTDGGCSPTEMMALMNNGGFGGNWNNPFSYILFMWLMRYMNNGYGYDGNSAELNFNNRQISQIQDTLNNNQNSNLLMDAIKGNSASIADLANSLNVNFNTLSQAICGVRASIESVAGQVGYSAEKVINAVNYGNAGVIQQLKDNAFNLQNNILTQGFENRLATANAVNTLGSKLDTNHAADMLSNCQQTNAIQNAISSSNWGLSSAIEGNKNALVKGFSDLGYLSATNTSNIIQAITAAQQKTSDQLSHHWEMDISQQLQDAKNEISQLKQTQTILSILAPRDNNGCNCGNN